MRGQALFLGHLRRAHGELHRVVPTSPEFRIAELGVVAADVEKDAALPGLDQKRQDRRLDLDTLAPIAGRDGLVVAMGRGEQRPEFEHIGHAGISSRAMSASLVMTSPNSPPSTPIIDSAAACSAG